MTDPTMTPHRDFLEHPRLHRRRSCRRCSSWPSACDRGAYTARPLTGKALAMIFMKASTRTRVSFEVGAAQLGGTAHFLSPRDVQLGRGEPVPDTARVLARYVQGIMIRTFAHADVELLAETARRARDQRPHRPARIPARCWPTCSPCGSTSARTKGRRVAWIGDGNNMANSWIEAAALLGFPLRLACPEGYDPDAGVPRLRARRRRRRAAAARPARGGGGGARGDHRRVGEHGAGGGTGGPGSRRSPAIR